MATLTETAYYTRRAINWTILGIITYFCLRILWFLVILIWYLLFPPQPPPPNHAFGVLPKIQFPQREAPPVALKFQLETVEGQVPVASSAAVVFFMPKSAANLLGLTRTQSFANRFLFTAEPVQESKNVYIFTDPQAPLRSLRYDIVSNNFKLRYLFEVDSSVFIEKNQPLPERAIENSLSTLKSFNLLPDDYKNGNQTPSFFRLQGNKLVSTTSQSTSDVVRVDLFRQSVMDIPVFTPIPEQGHINFIYSGAQNEKKRMIQFEYVYWPVDYQTTATYALKTSNQAWQELINGQGYVARYPRQGSTAVVREIYIGYYDSFEPQNYLQPIFVFEGDNGFLAYVPAVAAPWTE